MVGDVGGEWQARGGAADVEAAWGMRGPRPCGCHVPLRIESLNPAITFARQRAVVQVRLWQKRPIIRGKETSSVETKEAYMSC